MHDSQAQLASQHRPNTAVDVTHDGNHDITRHALTSLALLDGVDHELPPLLQGTSMTSLYLECQELYSGATHEIEHTPHLLQSILDECSCKREAAWALYLLHG
jgi:hypothetical protein